MLFNILKTVHIFSVIAWMAGLLYLPRIFVYHADEDIKNETDEFMTAFGVLGLDYEYDIKEKCNVPVDEDIFKKAEADCDFAGFDSFSLNKTNSESFYYLFNVYYNLMCEV